MEGKVKHMNMTLIKRNTLLVAICLALSLSWLGCKKSEPIIKAGPPPSGPVELKLKWPVGSRMVQNLDLKQTSETQVPGMPNPMKQDMTMGQRYARSVLKELPDGGHEVEMEFLSTRMSVTGGNQTAMAFDSSDKSSKTNPLAATFQKLAGAKVQFFLDASNEVGRIEGVDEFQQRMASGARNDPMGILKNLFSKDTFRNWMRENRSLPDKPVQPGDTWPVQMEIAMGELGTLLMDHTYTFKSWERRNEHNCARIEFDGTMKSMPGQNLKVSGMNVSIEGGKSSGETWFDLEQGMFVEATMNQDMTLVITVPNQGRGGPAGQNMTVTTILNQNITVKVEPAK